MNNGSSNAHLISERSYDPAENITRIDCTRRSAMRKQKFCGIALIAAAVVSVMLADNAELLLFLIPVGVYLIFTKKQILTF
jgi:hypothetical protein